MTDEELNEIREINAALPFAHPIARVVKVEISPAGIGFIRTTARKPGILHPSGAKRKAWLDD